MRKQGFGICLVSFLVIFLMQITVWAANTNQINYLKEAFDLTTKLQPKECDLVYNALGRGYFELEQYDQAASFASKISEVENKGIILSALAKRDAQLGKKDQAKIGLAKVVNLAKDFESPETMSEVMAEVVETYLILSESAQAVTALEKAESFLNHYQADLQKSKNQAKVILAGSYVQVGRVEQAKAIVQQLDQPNANQAWARIFRVFLKNKQEKQAVEVVGKVDDSFIKIDLLIDLAWKYLNEKQLVKSKELVKQAFTAAKKMNGVGKGASFAKVGRLYAKLDKVATGLVVLKSALESCSKTKAYYPSEFDRDYQKIAITYAQLGYIERAWKTALLVDEKLEKIETLLEIYQIGSKLSKKQSGTLEALKLAREIVPAMKYGQESANYQIAACLAETKLFKEAIQIGEKADSINQALIYVVVGVAQEKNVSKH